MVLTDPPDLILLDIKMPEMDGYEVCSLLKNNLQLDSGNFLSALDEVLDKVKAFSVGGVDYISKPFQFEEVFVRIENQLTIQRQKACFKRRFASLNWPKSPSRFVSPWSWSKFFKLPSRRCKKILQTDRAVIYHFLPDWSGKFVWWKLAPKCSPLLSRDFKDPCFEERYIEPYSQGV